MAGDVDGSTWDSPSGYVVVAGLLDKVECEAIVAQCHHLLADTATAHPRDKQFSGTRHLEELDRRIPLVAEVLSRDRLTEVVRAMTGRTTTPSQVSLRSPQPGYGAQDLHRDTIDARQGTRPTVVTAIVALVDFTATNGATRLVPGSHYTNESAGRYKGHNVSPDEISMIGPAGTGFVFSGHLLHSGTQNNSDVARPALQILWRLEPLSGGD